MEVKFFKDAAAFRRWLERHHDRDAELWVGFYRSGSGRGGLTYKEAVDEALCFGWIDGLRRSVDEASYTSRFTPRRARSIWSLVNTRRFGELSKRGLVAPAGVAAFEARDPKRSGIYSFENRPRDLPAAYVRRFKSEPHAWAFFQSQAPWYRRTATWWVISAVKEETRLRRLVTLIEDSARGRRLKMLTPAPGKSRSPASASRAERTR